MSGPLDVAAVIDADGTVIRWSRAAEQVWGYTAAEVLNSAAENLLMSVGEPDRAGPLCACGPWSGRVEVRRRDGRGQEVEFRASPVANDGKDQWLVWEVGPVRGPRRGINETLLRTLFEYSPMGLAIWNQDLRCVWHNDAAADQAFLSDAPFLGYHITELIPGRETEELEAAMRLVLENHVPALQLKWKRTSTARKAERLLSLSFVCVDDGNGLPLGVCSMAVDISEGLSREHRSLLLNAGTRIGTTLDVLNTAQELANIMVPSIADYVTVDLVDPVRLDTEPLRHLEATEISVPTFYRAGLASIRHHLPESLWQRGSPVFVPPSSPFTSVLASGKSHFEPVLDTSPGTWLDNDPDRARIIRENGMHSLLIVLLQARGRQLGIAVFVRTKNLASFTRDDLALAEELATRASVSLDNASRYSRERTAALALQRDLLPHRLRGGNSIEVASHYLPADTHGGVGGDWFDVIPMSDDRVALVVGDVVGHGINAAATMGRLRTAVNTLTNLELPPHELLTRMDELVVRLSGAPENCTAPTLGATCVYAVYDPRTRRCAMASAGHPPPAIVSPDGSVTFVDLPTGAPIGIGLQDYQSLEIEVPEGSLIALYTDGLVETRDYDIDHGLDRLRAALALPVSTLAEFCTETVKTMTGEGQSNDDIALLVARTLALSSETAK